MTGCHYHGVTLGSLLFAHPKRGNIAQVTVKINEACMHMPAQGLGHGDQCPRNSCGTESLPRNGDVPLTWAGECTTV